MANISRQVFNLWSKLKSNLRNLNLFPSVSLSTDEYELRTQRISTRLFIIILSLAMIVLLLYNSLKIVSKTIHVKEPSLAEYSSLNSTYSQTLVCPCTNVSIEYEKFLRIDYTLHPVCSSIFVDQSWINYLARFLTTKTVITDFVERSSFYFQTLNTFCDLINRTISNSLIEFYSNRYVSVSVALEQVFQSETEELIERFRSSITNNFLSSLAIIQDTTQANVLFSGVQTNYRLTIAPGRQTGLFSSERFGDCWCAISSACVFPSSIYDQPIRPFRVPGFVIGCFMVESLLQSTLECFFNQTCLDELREHLPSPPSMGMKALDTSLSNMSHINSTIRELLKQLMINRWDASPKYEKYYNQCQPTNCKYTLRTRNDAIYIITTLFAIAGGLTTVLKLILPRLIKLIRKKKVPQQPSPAVIVRLKTYLTTFNMFPSVPLSTDEHELRTQRMSTRWFIVIFSISLAILLLYNSLMPVTMTVDVKTPSFAEYALMNSAYPQTLTCPCSKISIQHDKYLRIDYTLHQVCTSMFVNRVKTIIGRRDFRWASSWSFQALKTLCELLDTTISDSLKWFYSYQYVTAFVKSEQFFELETNLSIKQFRSSIQTNFLSSLAMIGNTTEANALFSAIQTNYYLIIQDNDEVVILVPEVYNRCNCATSSKCIQPSSIIDHPNPTPLFIVPGFYVGCYVIESLLQSTLECFYHQSCIDTLHDYLNLSSRRNVSALDASRPSWYSINSTIMELVNQLMIEQWNPSLNYEQYYNVCRPVQCTYKYETRNDVIYIVTTLFGIAGGLTTVLKFTLPRLVKLLKKKKREQQPTNVPVDDERYVVDLWQKLRCYSQNLNLFKSKPPSTDERVLLAQRISTILFIILLILLMAILLFYTSLIPVTKTVIIKEPSFAEYSQLNSTYKQTLTCSCWNVSIDYKKFLHVEYTLHQVCSSVFVHKTWVDNLVLPYGPSTFTKDFQRTGHSTFRALEVFCDLVNLTISDSLTGFYANQYTSASVISQEQLELENDVAVNRFRSSMIVRFLLSLSMIRDTTQANALLSAHKTNYQLYIRFGEVHAPIDPEIYNNCSCVHSSKCTDRSSVFEYVHRTPVFVIPGFRTGCYVIESLLQSTLECFYEQHCIDRLQGSILYYSPINVTALNPSLPSRYFTNSTVQELLDSLMIERWNWSTLYEQYYNECHPKQCIYTFETRNDLIYIVTTLFGLAGGLTTVLKLVVPRFVKFVIYCIQKRRTSVAPSTS